jgi:digalactosyldiacylglycerol synthase
MFYLRSNLFDGGAFAFISKGWREARDTATADLSLMRARADHLIASAPFAEELDLVRKRIQPKITELRWHCSLEGWPPRAGASLRVDLACGKKTDGRQGRLRSSG